MAKMKRKTLSEAAGEMRREADQETPEQGAPKQAAAESPPDPPPPLAEEPPKRYAAKTGTGKTWSRILGAATLVACLATLAAVVYAIVSLAEVAEQAEAALAQAQEEVSARNEAALAQMRELSAQNEAALAQTREISAQMEALRQQSAITQRALNVSALSQLARDLATAYYRAGGATNLAADSARALPPLLSIRVGALADALEPHQPDGSPPPPGACEGVERSRPLSPERGQLLVTLARHRFDVSSPSFRQAQLDGSVLDSVTLSGVNLVEADLSGAALPGVYLTGGADLTRADLHEANLAGARLAGAVLEQACLLRADLSGTDLSGAMLRSSDLSGAELSGALLQGAAFDDAVLDEANLCAAEGLTVEQLRSARSLEGAHVSDSLHQQVAAPGSVSCAK